jgi:hypothetical protein
MTTSARGWCNACGDLILMDQPFEYVLRPELDTGEPQIYHRWCLKSASGDNPPLAKAPGTER